MATGTADVTARITDELKTRGMPALTAAELIGIPSSTWYRRMRHPDGWTLGELALLAAALKVPISRLIGDQ